MDDSEGVLRSLDIAEPSPLDLNLAVALPRSISYFTADVLAFAIAIGPYDKRSGSSRLVFDVLGDGLVILLRVSCTAHDSKTVDIAYIWNHRQHGSVKQPVRWRILPLLEVGGKLDGCQMPLDGGHGHGAVSPWRAKVIVERVVFDVGISCVCLEGVSDALNERADQRNSTQSGTGRPRGGPRRLLRWRAFQPHREPAS